MGINTVQGYMYRDIYDVIPVVRIKKVDALEATLINLWYTTKPYFLWEQQSIETPTRLH